MSSEQHPDLQIERLPSRGGNSTVLLDDRQVINLPLGYLRKIGYGGVKAECTVVGGEFDRSEAEENAWYDENYPRFVIANGRDATFSLAAGMLLNPDFPYDGPAEDFRGSAKDMLALAHELSKGQAVLFGNKEFMQDPTDGYGITLMAGDEHSPSVVGLVLDEQFGSTVTALKLNEQVLRELADGAYDDSLVGWLGIEQNGLITLAGPNAILLDSEISAGEHQDPGRRPHMAVTSREFFAPVLREKSIVIRALRSAIEIVLESDAEEATEVADSEIDGVDAEGGHVVDTQGIVGAVVRSMQGYEQSRSYQ
jgi:hypothetical protein